MKYKAIFIDIDGTLVTLDNSKKEEPGEVLQFFLQKGLLAAFVTGRGLYYVADLLKNHISVLDNYFILYDGALVINPHNGHMLHSNPLNADVVQYVCEQLASITSNVYLNKLDAVYSKHNQLSKQSSLSLFWKELDDYSRTYQVYVRDVKNEERVAVEFILAAADLSFYSFPSLRGGFSYIAHHKDSDKARAVRVFLKEQNLKEEEVIIVGDGINDLPLFNLGVYKIAAHSALPQVKEKADFVMKEGQTILQVISLIRS